MSAPSRACSKTTTRLCFLRRVAVKTGADIACGHGPSSSLLSSSLSSLCPASTSSQCLVPALPSRPRTSGSSNSLRRTRRFHPPQRSTLACPCPCAIPTAAQSRRRSWSQTAPMRSSSSSSSSSVAREGRAPPNPRTGGLASSTSFPGLLLSPPPSTDGVNRLVASVLADARHLHFRKHPRRTSRSTLRCCNSETKSKFKLWLGLAVVNTVMLGYHKAEYGPVWVDMGTRGAQQRGRKRRGRVTDDDYMRIYSSSAGPWLRSIEMLSRDPDSHPADRDRMQMQMRWWWWHKRRCPRRGQVQRGEMRGDRARRPRPPHSKNPELYADPSLGFCAQDRESADECR
ncbi:hypothetical protein EDB92DRAFT_1561973 [Lactarius akahatsu]|uniref:Uncharacterized protein n=1 Tax=Lactarius akahatsu TaxID=416441 RepID=A0AAD4Q747_9AGAM|nr:hypothetical protein EDB92DRAFT_1561973 [Lactarius akahatsu]